MEYRRFFPAVLARVGIRNGGMETATWDRFGMVASSLCAVHCLCLPWLVIAMPFLSRTLVADPFAERVFVMGSICLALTCALIGLKKTGSWWPVILVAAGAGTLTWVHATAPPACCAKEIEWTQALSSGLGGGLLATSHFVGMRLRRLRSTGFGCGSQDCRCDGE